MANPNPSKLFFSVFNGAITTHLPAIPNPNRSFAYTVTFTRSLWPPAFTNQKPPLHFHPHQEEYIQVTEGSLCVDIEGAIHTLRPSSGELCVSSWKNHRLYPPPDFGGHKTIRFLLGGEACERMFRLDNLFFENWYRYQEEVVGGGKGVNLIQVTAMFDAGGSYLSLPAWVPFSRTCAVALGVVGGRWIGGCLGYQPYYRQWTSDWVLAGRKMKRSFWQRRFATT
ncbi:hypothetical protein BBP40_008606 [Aspergillus hancockii]|nr:hypothetical protein BBP40_008606 [Aspergillus hancockii]